MWKNADKSSDKIIIADVYVGGKFAAEVYQWLHLSESYYQSSELGDLCVVRMSKLQVQRTQSSPCKCSGTVVCTKKVVTSNGRKTEEETVSFRSQCHSENYSTESYPGICSYWVEENPGKNLNQVTCPNRESNPGHLVSRPDALTVTSQVWTRVMSCTRYVKQIQNTADEGLGKQLEVSEVRSIDKTNGGNAREDMRRTSEGMKRLPDISDCEDRIDRALERLSAKKKSAKNCAAQQLNASQSTHRFSFVNHTIKTVNMPKVRHSVNLKSKLTSYISEFKEDGLSTDNKILFCNLCQCAVSSTQKFLVQQHITTSKHQANKQLNSKQRQLFLTQPTTSNVRSEFNIDLCRSLISADIPLYKLKNKVFREFLEKYTQHTIPDESTLRKTYAPSIYDETIQKIRDEIKDSSIWVSIDETPDKEGRLVGNVVIEKCNNKTIVKLFNEAMGILWPKGIMYDNVLFFISDAAPYMVKAGQALSVVYPKLTHFTCVAHAFHRVAEVVRDNFLKQEFNQTYYNESVAVPNNCPWNILTPATSLDPWKTWLDAVNYYAKYYGKVMKVIDALDSTDSSAVAAVKSLPSEQLLEDILFIDSNFKIVSKSITLLESFNLQLSEALNIVYKISQTVIQNNNSLISEKMKLSSYIPETSRMRPVTGVWGLARPPQPQGRPVSHHRLKSLRDRVPNEVLQKMSAIKDPALQATNTKWKWGGHVARLRDGRWTHKVTLWDPRIVKRSRGRPRRR
ncbi:hypothetical protein ANN_05013 [Periplaneta americana]|uniref:DUF659 domain-containing protein n=1 Tax=Periplaneta americana TaxID=6978 RepID=A0ABQ8TBX0_PERAM|nr:hypothetical protein ANN_05013 [Periplaneta americana]